MPSDKVLIDIKTKSVLERKVKNHLRHTNLFLTINTNKRFDPDSQEFEEAEAVYKDIINSIFNQEFKDKYVQFKVMGHEWASHIEKAKIENSIEIGPKTGTLHSHHMVSFSHCSLIKVNTDQLKNDLREQLKIGLGCENIYMNVKYFYNASDSLEKYFEKQTIGK